MRPRIVPSRHRTAWESLGDRVHHLLFVTSVEYAEIVSLLASLLWGAWVLGPWATFGSSATFRVMASLAPEMVWGAAVLILGIAQFLSLLFDHRTLRIGTNSAACILWMFMASTFWFSNYQATASVIYPLISLAGGWASVRVILSAPLDYRGYAG